MIHCPRCGYGYDCRTDAFVSVPSLHLPEGYIKGTNGAGDAYCSGILYGAYQGMTLEESMILGQPAQPVLCPRSTALTVCVPMKRR